MSMKLPAIVVVAPLATIQFCMSMVVVDWQLAGEHEASCCCCCCSSNYNAVLLIHGSSKLVASP
jgi:hypothetical protein